MACLLQGPLASKGAARKLQEVHACSRAQGAQLEPDLGSGRFLALVAELLALSHCATVALAALGARLAPNLAAAQYYEACGVGFSAVLFALKVVLSHRTPGWSSVCGVPLPTKARAGLFSLLHLPAPA